MSRRLVVTLGSMVVTGVLWGLFVLLARRPLWQRACVMMLVALPAALLLTLLNGWAFADLDHEAASRDQEEQGVDVLDDGRGNVIEVGAGRVRVRGQGGAVVDLGDDKLTVRGRETALDPDPDPNPDRELEVPSPPAPPSPPRVAAPPPGAIPRVPPAEGRKRSTSGKPASFWEEYADMVLSRYFLLLAWMAIYVALASAEQARAAERREGDYRRAAQAAELRSLRYQINPHFLFNTLNSLSALVLTGKPAAAERMIQTLSNFYRRGLTTDSTGDVRLAEEIGLQKLYLEIEAVRFPDRLRIEVDVPQSLEDALVPGMILQPLVENSIKYAVAVSTRPVTLTIAARAEGDRLVLSVGDDGPGGGESDGCGIGLANVRDRLRARFDGAAAVDVGPLPQGGFRTVIRLPLQREGGGG